MCIRDRLVSIDNIQGENNHIYSTIMVRKDLVKSSKPKVILGDRFYSSYIATFQCVFVLPEASHAAYKEQ